MIDPSLFASVPFGNRTAALDTIGTMELYLYALAKAVHDVTGRSFAVLPVGTPGGAEWLQGFQQTLDNAGEVLGINIPNISTYDLSDEGDWASWTFVVSNTLQQLRDAAGVS